MLLSIIVLVTSKNTSSTLPSLFTCASSFNAPSTPLPPAASIKTIAPASPDRFSNSLAPPCAL